MPSRAAAAVAQPGRTAGVAGLLLAAAMVGAGAIAAKEAYSRGAEPESLVVARMALGAAAFAPLALVLVMRAGRAALHWPSLGAAALAGAALLAGVRGEFEGLDRLPAAVLVLLIYVTPVWVVLIEKLFWGTRISAQTALAIGLVLLGVVIMVGSFGASLDPFGVASGLGASFAFAAFLILIGRGQARLPPLLGMSVTIVTAGALALALSPGAVAEELGRPGLAPLVVAVAISLSAWGVLAAIGLRTLAPLTAAVVSASEPVFVALIAFVLLGESLSARELLGAVVLLAGVFTIATAPDATALRARDGFSDLRTRSRTGRPTARSSSAECCRATEHR